MQLLASPSLLPFSVAAAAVLGLLLLEIGLTLAGKPLSALIEHAAHHADSSVLPLDGKEGLFGEALHWLNGGRVPLLVLLVIFLSLFAIAGFVVQGAAHGIVATLPWPLAVPLAVGVALPATRAASRGIARLMPRDESYATTTAEFVGLTGVVTLGPIKTGRVGKVRLRDAHGNTHFPRAEPHDPVAVHQEGTIVLVVEARGQVVAVVRAEGALGEAKG